MDRTNPLPGLLAQVRRARQHGLRRGPDTPEALIYLLQCMVQSASAAVARPNCLPPPPGSAEAAEKLAKLREDCPSLQAEIDHLVARRAAEQPEVIWAIEFDNELMPVKFAWIGSPLYPAVLYARPGRGRINPPAEGDDELALVPDVFCNWLG